jgi:hypothetical protein
MIVKKQKEEGFAGDIKKRKSEFFRDRERIESMT